MTNCTSRKALPASRRLQARSMPKGTLREISKEWKRRVRAADKRVAVKELYQGRAHCEAMEAARLAQTRLCVISAGMGLITETDRIPAYSLTISDNQADSISRRVVNGVAFSPQEWWAALGSNGIRTRSLAEVIARSKNKIFILALSSAYLTLVADDLLALKKRDLKRVRLIGPRRAAEVEERLQHLHMPYDSRLDGVKSPIRGTESDFPQRAARHFVEHVLRKRKKQTLEGHRAMVLRSLRGWPHRKPVVRRKLPEAQLRQVVKRVLRQSGGHWSVALRRLRDDLNVACEQGRFHRICNDIKRGRG